MTCFGYEGIDAVKASLRAAEAIANPSPATAPPATPASNPSLSPDASNTVKVKLVSPPLYVLTSQCLDKQEGIKTLEEAIKAIQNVISGKGGNAVVKMAPKAVTESDDAELLELMEKRERENAEISGDEDESGSDEGPIAGDI